MHFNLIRCSLLAFSVAFCAIVNNVFAQPSGTHYPVSVIIEQVKKKYAPDKRVAVFQVELDSNRITGRTNLPQAKKELISRLKSNGYNLINDIQLLPDEEELGGKTYALVNVSVANIRSQPREAAELSTQALLGTQLKVLDKERYWYMVQTPDHYIGWVEGTTIKRMVKADIDQYQLREKLLFIKPFGFAYADSNEDAQTVSDLTWGDLLVVKDTLPDFYGVAYPDGRKAFVSKREVVSYQDWKKITNPNPEALTRTANRMMGLPYLWGGTSWKGVDCSGYMRMVYLTNGILLPRDASQQVFVGEEVSFADLKVGDLMFFGEKATTEKTEKVVHVGMWLGNGEFIHSSGMVRIGSFDKDKPNYDEGNVARYLRARRILGYGADKGVVALKNH